ncbi:hypothetical protein JW752_00625 [Candidatus Peregrinibacteria bacterium]|nr:hypothetical protein [Candidatus Peregrinibacteria bacterium]
MKELFNKLSNLFSFGKEHRLVNEGAEAPKPVENVQEAQEAETAPPKTPEEGVRKAEIRGSEKMKKSLSWLTGAKEAKDIFDQDSLAKGADEAFKGAKADTPETPMRPRGTAEDAKKALEAAAMASMEEAQEKGKTREGLAELGKQFMGKAGEETAVAQAGKTPEEMGPFEPLDLSEGGEREMTFTEEEVAQMMKEAEAEGQKPDEALMAAAHQAGVEAEKGKTMEFTKEEVAEALGPFEPLDLGEEEVAARTSRGAENMGEAINIPLKVSPASQGGGISKPRNLMTAAEREAADEAARLAAKEEEEEEDRISGISTRQPK